MKHLRSTRSSGQGFRNGFTILELVIVVAIVLIVAAFAIPSIATTLANIRLRAAAGNLSGLMQEARILAAQNNNIYPVYYLANGAYVDLNLNGSFSTGEPLVNFSGTVVPASAAPSGGGGQPTPYTLNGSSSSTSYDNTTTLAFSPRGLPCKFDNSTTPPTCATPAAKYFVYYLTDSRPGGGQSWAAVVVSKAGRTRTVIWDGRTWR